MFKYAADAKDPFSHARSDSIAYTMHRTTPLSCSLLANPKHSFPNFFNVPEILHGSHTTTYPPSQCGSRICASQTPIASSSSIVKPACRESTLFGFPEPTSTPISFHALHTSAVPSGLFHRYRANIQHGSILYSSSTLSI